MGEASSAPYENQERRMGSRANVAPTEDGETKIYYFLWLAQEMDAFTAQSPIGGYR